MVSEADRSWGSEEIVARIYGIHEQYVGMIPILDRFRIDHAHWSRRFQPWYGGILLTMNEEFPLIDTVIEYGYRLYLRLHGLPTRRTYSLRVFEPPANSRWPAHKAILLPELDFRIYPKGSELRGYSTDLQATREEGSIYEMYVNNLSFLKGNLRLTPDEQELIATIEANRV